MVLLISGNESTATDKITQLGGIVKDVQIRNGQAWIEVDGLKEELLSEWKNKTPPVPPYPDGTLLWYK